MRVLITGATGSIGGHIGKRLTASGHSVVSTTRDLARANLKKKFSAEFIQWAGAGYPLDLRGLGHLDGVIHLMGEPIADHRWSKQRKEELWKSRVHTGAEIVRALKAANLKIQFFIQASALGFYGDRGDEILDESSPAGSGFLSELCREWEAATKPAADFQYRHVVIRIPIVLDRRSGMLAKVLPIFKLGLGGRVGSGEQYMTWAHIDDVARAFEICATNSAAEGVYLAGSPNPVTNAEFTKALGRALHRPTPFPVPAFALRMMLGEMSSLLLESQRCGPRRLGELGFRFEYETLEQALRKIFGSKFV